MKLIPAIDLLGGKAVRLRQGRRDDVTVYSDQPWQLPAAFAAAGAERVHVVDLNGAFGDAAGSAAGLGAPSGLARVIAESPLPVQLGGGLRTRAAVEAALAAGAARVVIGTLAVTAPDIAADLCRAHAGRIVVAVDARDGMVAIRGWQETAAITATELARRAAAWGAVAVLYTDVARDGMATGPAVEATAALVAEVGDAVEVIASGGISSLADLRALAARGIPQAVLGRALYDGAFTLAEAIAAC